MKSKKQLVFSPLVLVLIVCAPPHVYATAIAYSDISFSNLRIVPTSGTVQYFGPWLAEAFAQADDSLGPRHQTSAVPADAIATYASGHGFASALDVTRLTGSAASDARILGSNVAQASSVGLGTLSDLFTVTGGSGSVVVNFLVDIAGELNVFTDASGERARTRTIFAAELSDTLLGDALSFDPIDLILDVGPNSTDHVLFNRTLSASMSLNFNTPYYYLAQADSESFAMNSAVPEPSTITLMVIGLGLMALSLRTSIHRKLTCIFTKTP